MPVLFFLLGVYIGQEFTNFPNIKSTCMLLYNMYEHKSRDNSDEKNKKN